MKLNNVKTVRGNQYIDTWVEAIQENKLAYLFLVPLLSFIIFLVWVPFLQGIWMSLHTWPFGSGEATFVGLDNYTYLFTWDGFYTGLKATIIYGFATVLQLVIALVAALTINKVRFKSILSGMYLLPYTMPPVATGTLWLFLLDPSLGPVFGFLTKHGILDEPIYWSTSGDTALAAITLVGAWTFWPFMFIILYATLVSIPDEYYESAKVYGASRIQTFRYVTLPQMKTAIFVVFTLRIVWNLTKISQPLQMTHGGPGNDTSILSLLLYRFAFVRGNLGMAFAVGLIFLLLVFGFIILFIRSYEKQEGNQI
ncbi:carbohydrate ABC transporter permease [Natronorubrum halophilum]|uniref:carbohydrate ABC transporter permease n=1 Tax=Natronorubrum halophilum TaxID=1702106 RepID=UPI0010C15F99|nr:sugar ABC transporter permease [Natronorubrum halophilum]